MELKHTLQSPAPGEGIVLIVPFMELKPFPSFRCRSHSGVLIVPFMELKRRKNGRYIDNNGGLNRTFYGIETKCPRILLSSSFES